MISVKVESVGGRAKTVHAIQISKERKGLFLEDEPAHLGDDETARQKQEEIVLLILVRLEKVQKWNLSNDTGPDRIVRVSEDTQTLCIVTVREINLVSQIFLVGIERTMFSGTQPRSARTMIVK